MSIPQTTVTNTELSLLPKESLPTMYDLPSEDPEEDGLPDTYHDFQPELLRKTCQPQDYYPDKLYSGTDLHIYYDVNHPKWYKRPDWFLVIGVDFLYKKIDYRQSYLMWQEEKSPLIIVELLSPGTAKEDLGENITKAELEIDKDVEIKEPKSPTPKWEVYEKILKVTYYFVFNDMTNKLRYFKLINGKYQEQIIVENEHIWIPELKLGLGLWYGNYDGLILTWLRWFDELGNMILTGEESAKKERLEKERERLAKQLALQEKEEEKLAKEQERIAKELALQQIEEEKLAKQLALQEKEEEKLAKELALQQIEAEKLAKEQERIAKELAIQEKKLALQQVAQNLLNSGMNIDQICAITGLNREDIMS